MPDSWFQEGGAGWSPRLYEWYFTKTPLGKALRAHDSKLIHDALDRVIEPQHSVLDFGCGTGNYTVPVARRCRRVVALDASPQMLGHLRERLAREGIEGVETGVGRLPEGISTTERFDGAMVLGVLNYVADLEGALCTIASVLAPGGWAILTVPPPSLEGRLHRLVERAMRRRVYLWGARETREAAEGAGLAVTRARTAGVTPGGITVVLEAVRP